MPNHLKAALAGAALSLIPLLAACQQEEIDPVLPLAEGPDEADCAAEGGRLVASLRGYVCAYPTVDAGKLCSRNQDCSTDCLAPERGAIGQCASESPMFGCIKVFVDVGERAVLCID